MKIVKKEAMEVKARLKTGWRVWRFYVEDYAVVQAMMLEEGRDPKRRLTEEQALVMCVAIGRKIEEDGL